MIINVGARTDIVNHYGKWLMNRFREGFVYTRNPLFPTHVFRYELVPDKVDALLFCSKNYAPFLENLAVLERDYRLYCHYTVTAYGRDIEPNVPDIETSVRTLLEVEKIVGKGRLAWRYDPVLLTENYTVERHLATFEGLCAALSGHVDRCIFSFVEMYTRLGQNLRELIPLTIAQKHTLASGFSAIAARYRIPIQTCGDNDFTDCNVTRAGCVTLEMLGKANGCVFRTVKHNGNRRGCLCIESRDLGWYDSCPNGCRYCYANHRAEDVAANILRHDPDSPLLIGHLHSEDTLTQGIQRSLLKGDGKQISLFDL